MSEDSGIIKKTSEAAANAGASFAGSMSGGLSLGANSSKKKTTTTKTKKPDGNSQQQTIQSGAGQPSEGRITRSQQKKLSHKEADSQYEEKMEEEYAKREGGA
ncbi:hypothetical protein EDD36DRAFT_8162 [Exophiala viscosa]|uniref:Uncharacterized protein n=1 Tax=Exophiala viscosa TaxID=2486360 RepID=A0AAN6E5N2_9EURO|nr:hypothetical protein EDD36DRAFT_8162 [Exophiala viscosa]